MLETIFMLSSATKKEDIDWNKVNTSVKYCH